MAFLRRFHQGRSSRQSRVRAGTSLLLISGSLLVAFLVLAQPLQSLQWSLSDSLFQGEDQPPGIVLAEIDDRALETHGRFGDWSRTLHARAVDNLSGADARVVVFDLLFIEPSPDDEELAESFAAANNVVLALAGVQPLGNSAEERYAFQSVLLPAEDLKEAAVQLGHVNFPPDGDGVLRRMPVVIRDNEGQGYPALAVAAIFAQTERALPPDLAQEAGTIRVLNQEVPVDEAGAVRPNFTAHLESFDRVSYADIIDGSFDPGLVRGKMVIVGLTATGSGDQHLIPLGGDTEPGVVAIGNAILSLQDGVFVREASDFEVLLSLLPLAAVMMYAVPRFNVRLTVLLLALAAAGTYLMAVALFNSDEKLIMNLVYPAIVLPVMFVIGLAHRVTSERADRRDLSDLFGRLASPEVVQELVDEADRGQLELGGTIREVTVLFADLRGFTGISERLPPNEVVEFLNRAFDVMIESIVRHGGIVNKFGGDMVMAIWNAPRETPDHAVKACRASLDALAGMEARGLWLSQEPEARFGFGINSGDVVVGNVGSAGRLEYTVMGDPVNVASRLCGAAGGGEVWIGERTRELAASVVEAESLGPQTLKGRSRPVEAFRITGIQAARPPAAAESR